MNLSKNFTGTSGATAFKATIPYVIVCVFSAVVFLAVFVLFAGLTPLGYWHDEYDAFATLRNINFFYWNAGLTLWIPRPVSNLLIGIYGLAVLNTHRQLVASALLPLWLSLFACVALAPALCFRKHGWQDKAPLLLLGLALMSMFLLGHPIAEAFYWPMAAFAYLPTLGGICVLLWSVCAGATETKRGRAVCSAATLIAAASSEMGAMFVCIFTGLAIAEKFFGAPDPGQSRRSKISPVWLLIPLAFSLSVVFMVAIGRGQDASEGLGVGDALVRHHAANSISAAFPAFVRELFFADSAPLRDILAKGVFFVGSYLILSNILSGLGRRAIGYYLIDIVVACIATFFLTIVAGFYQFGLDCCQHHSTVRQCLIFVSLIAGSGAVAIFRTRSKRYGVREIIAAIGCLILAVAILTYNAIPKLAFDYINFDLIKNARISNWQAGMRAGESMTYSDPPYGKIVGGWSGLSGTYTRSSAPPAQLGMLKFFKKDSVTYIPAAPLLMSVEDAYWERPTDLAKFKAVSAEDKISAVRTTSCNIELINFNHAPDIKSVSKSEVAQISGWSLMQTPEQLPDSVFLSMQSGSSDYIIRVRSGGLRPDVPAYFKLPASLNRSGFHVAADLSDISPGQYVISVLSVRGAARQICGKAQIMVRE